MKEPFFKFVGNQAELQFVCSHWRTLPKIGESYSIHALFTLLQGEPRFLESDLTLNLGAFLENIKKQPLLWIETTDEKAETPPQVPKPKSYRLKRNIEGLNHSILWKVYLETDRVFFGRKKSRLSRLPTFLDEDVSSLVEKYPNDWEEVFEEEHKPEAFFPKKESDPLNDYMNHSLQMKFGELPRPHPMDVVTLDRLQTVLKYFDIEIHPTILDKVIDVVELLVDKGDKTSLMDMEALRQEWIDYLNLPKGIFPVENTLGETSLNFFRPESKAERTLKDIDIEREKAMFVPEKASGRLI